MRICSLLATALRLGLLLVAFGADAGFVLDRGVMDEKYWTVWNDVAQAKIDADIRRYRMADVEITIGAEVPVGTVVQIEQVDHAFYFGAHIFNFNQLGKREWNDRYKALYGTLFNSATVAFYWRTLEPTPDAVRFGEEVRDTEDYWNNCTDPTHQPHWRRPPPDPVIAYLKTRRVRIHGHPLTWGDLNWHYPPWIFDSFCPENEKRALEAAAGIVFPTQGVDEHVGMRMRKWHTAWKTACERLYGKSEGEIFALAPTYFTRMREIYAERVACIARRYGARVDSWDVVNESSQDYQPSEGSVTGRPLQKSANYGFMPGDYAFQAFLWAQTNFPASARLNINDFNGNDNFVAQAKDLMAHGARIDVVGSQMHLFDPKDADAIAAGTFGTNEWQRMMAVASPEDIYRKFARLSKLNRPIHLSEITITAGEGNSLRGQMVQANILRNLYRIWFSLEKMNGITWWNVVDDCGAPDEPSYSGLFTRDMRPKPAYYAMEQLINHEWRTKTESRVEGQGEKRTIAFRGFKGRYRLTWKGSSGEECVSFYEVR